jgi:Zn-dependent protease
MFSSLKLGKFFGIDLYVHGTFWLLPLFVLFMNFGSGYGQVASELMFVFGVFACVALHEVGHALASAAYGIRTRDITLYPVGGVASLERMPEKPWQEIAVALAGPAVNVVIAGGLLAGILAGEFLMPWTYGGEVVGDFLARLFWANVVLCAFNLLPAFPMDGGRVLRALLAIRMTRLRATEVAVRVGTLMAVAFLVAGVVFGAFSLILVAVVVWMLGQGELAAIRVTERRRDFERRARELFGRRAPDDSSDTDADLAARRFTGLAWDDERGVWVQWDRGVPVREIPG